MGHGFRRSDLTSPSVTGQIPPPGLYCANFFNGKPRMKQGRTYAFLNGGGKEGNFGAYLDPKIFGAYPQFLGPIRIF